VKTSVRHMMLRHETVTETFEHAAALGFDGIELNWIEDEHWPELLSAVKSTGVKPALIAPSERGAMHADPGERRKWFNASKRALDRCAETGAVGFIVVPTLPNKMQGMPRLPDLWPLMNQMEAEKSVFVEMLHDLGDHAAKGGTYVVLECLNRYEQFWPLSLADGVEICQRADSKGVGILADFFHMNIEEAQIGESIAAAMDHIVHVHIADSHRKQPGTGHTDFGPGLKALQDGGYDKYLGFEYSTQGDRDADMMGAIAHIKGLLANL